jgi:hypothetical protein
LWKWFDNLENSLLKKDALKRTTILILLIIRLHSKGLEGNIRCMNINNILLHVFTKTLAFKMKDCHFEMLWNHVFLMGLMLQEDISNLLN